MPYVLYGIILIALIILVRNIRIVPQAQAYVITRLGAYKTTWGVGLHLKIPFIEAVAKRLSLKEQVADFPPQPSASGGRCACQCRDTRGFCPPSPSLRLASLGSRRETPSLKPLVAFTSFRKELRRIRSEGVRSLFETASFQERLIRQLEHA